jgi:CheY-like chemotaxis protein
MSHSRICLVVDDEVRVRGYIRTVLQGAGHEVLEAEDGMQAVETLRRVAGVKLIIADIHMPLMNGLELAELVSVEFPDTPILLVSGYTSTPAIEGVPVLQKPFLPAALLRVADDVVLRRQTAAAGAKSGAN